MVNDSNTFNDVPSDGAEKGASWPANIGPYRILGILGRGGMGTVYLAEQDEPVRRQVALKIINWGMESENIIARFHSERQALALMNHPYIAAVYEADKTPEGVPFFVMERVDGEPVLQYCDRVKLSVQDRLKLFLKVCEGVHHAHQKMVIHRDLKPSNILVVERDGVPDPKLIDFGIAKATKVGVFSEQPGLTQEGSPLGTPMYMSPEQVQGENLDARADVYALGVLLYELLVGTAPFNAKNADYFHLLVKVVEEEPPAPSTRLTSLKGNSGEIVKVRGTDQKGLVRQLKGDLDWVILKAMEKERHRRYGSVAELKADIENYLQCKPVSAKPPSFQYNVLKFVQRHKVGVVAAFLVVLALILGIAGTTFGMMKAVDAREQAEASRQRAVGTLAYLQKILSSVDPSSEGRQMKIVDLLEGAVNTVDQELNGQPQVEAMVRKTIGWSFLEMGLYEEAEAQLRRSHLLQSQTLGPNDLETLSTYNALGRVLYKKGQYALAESIHRVVYRIESERLGPSHSTTLWTRYNLAKALDKQGQFGEAESIYRDIVDTRTQTLGPLHPNTLVAINSLALLLAFDDRGAEGEAMQTSNLEALEATLGRSHPQTLNAMANLVAIRFLVGQNVAAEHLAEETIALQVEIMGETHPEALETQTYLAKAQLAMGNFAEAETKLSKVLDIQCETLGEKNPETIGTQASLAHAHLLKGDLDVAHKMAEKAEMAALEVLGPSHWLTAYCTGLNGLSLVELGHWDRGEIKLLTALENFLPFQHSEKQMLYRTLSDHYRRQGDIEKADSYADRLEL